MRTRVGVGEATRWEIRVWRKDGTGESFHLGFLGRVTARTLFERLCSRGEELMKITGLDDIEASGYKATPRPSFQLSGGWVAGCSGNTERDVVNARARQEVRLRVPNG